jgi:hypothetical protein
VDSLSEQHQTSICVADGMEISDRFVGVLSVEFVQVSVPHNEYFG